MKEARMERVKKAVLELMEVLTHEEKLELLKAMKESIVESQRGRKGGS